MAATTTTATAAAASILHQIPSMLPFGRISVRSSQVFFATRHSFGLVNLKPFRPGHVLVVSRRPVQRMSELTAEEVSDIFTNAQTVCRVVEKVWNAEAVTVAVQDGEAAGQTVPHFHVHLIPRRTGDYPHNDDVYRDLEDKRNMKEYSGRTGVDCDERKPRSEAEMAEEANILRKHFPPFIVNNN